MLFVVTFSLPFATPDYFLDSLALNALVYFHCKSTPHVWYYTGKEKKSQEEIIMLMIHYTKLLLDNQAMFCYNMGEKVVRQLKKICLISLILLLLSSVCLATVKFNPYSGEYERCREGNTLKFNQYTGEYSYEDPDSEIEFSPYDGTYEYE